MKKRKEYYYLKYYFGEIERNKKIKIKPEKEKFLVVSVEGLPSSQKYSTSKCENDR